MANKTFSGARAVVYIDGKPIGTISNFSYGVTNDVQPVFILGRYSPAELTYTAQEPVRCTATGWRAYGFGPHETMKMPKLQDLLNQQYFQISVHDRQAAAGAPPIATIKDVLADSYSSTIASRALTEVTHSFIGMLVDDESTTNNETPGAMDLPA